MKRLLRNIPLKRFCRDLNLILMGFERKTTWVWERFEWGKGRELKSVLKFYHISHIKLKTRVFCGLHTRKKHIWSTKLSREAFSREIVARQSRKSLSEILCFPVFALTSFCRKSLVASFSRKCLWRSFWRTTQKCILKQKLKAQK